MVNKRDHEWPYLHQTEWTLNKKTITQYKGRHYIMLKGPIHQEDITIINIYSSNLRVPKHMKQTLAELKQETDSNKRIVGDVSTLLSILDRTCKISIRKQGI